VTTLGHVCRRGRITTTGARCPGCEHERNQQPHRVAHRTRIHRTLRARVLARDNHACCHCGRDNNLTIDYVIPMQKGGTQTADNAQTLCRSCNSRKGART